MEYMASGLPVVATDLGGNSEVIDKNRGILVGKGDARALSEGIKLLAANEDLRLQMGINSRRKVMENFMWDRVGPQIEEVYENVFKAPD
jgi:glycosyltransferase involved in cell wall biosynthesis